MTYRIRYTRAAREDLHRLFAYLLERDALAARRARDAIVKAAALLADFPFTCRKVDENDPFLRELLVPFGSSGYVALFEIEKPDTVTILAIRHQREEDYH
jgi:plasmid stabilization system protein ParE